MSVESGRNHASVDLQLPRHTIETITPKNDKNFKVDIVDTLPLIGEHNGFISSSPGLGAFAKDPMIVRFRDALNELGYEAVDWFESSWGNRLAPFGKDAGLENVRALKSHDIALEETVKRTRERAQEHGRDLLLRSSGWSRGAAIAAAGAARNISHIDSLILLFPGFMEDESWSAAKRYFSGRASDFRKGMQENGITHLRDSLPFLLNGLKNMHRMVHRGGATAGWAPIAEMLAVSLAGKPIAVVQGKYDETFPPEQVRSNIKEGYSKLLDALAESLGITYFDKEEEVEKLLPDYYEFDTGHGLGPPKEAAKIFDFIIRETDQKIAA